jgi:hypothetical protein
MVEIVTAPVRIWVDQGTTAMLARATVLPTFVTHIVGRAVCWLVDQHLPQADL